MVTVDDATYVAMRDNLYKWDAWAASRAKAKIESSYSQQQYDTFLSQLNGLNKQQTATTQSTRTTPTPKDTSWDQWNGNYVYNPNTWYYEKEWTARATQTTPTTKQDTSTKQQETVGNTVGNNQQQGAMKPLSQDYYNQTSEEAQNQIRDNLNRYKQSNPEYFTDYESFKKNFSYDMRDEVQKNTLDQWYKWYQEGLSLASTPTTDLYTQYQNWNISSEQLEQLRISDPTKYSELMNQINKWNIISAYDDDKWMDSKWNSIQDMAYQMLAQTFNKFMLGDTGSEASQYFAEYKANMDSPEMLGLSDQCTELQEQMENIQNDLDMIKKSVEEEYEGTGATRSKINAIISDRSYDLQLQLRTLNSEYNKVATQYNNRMQQYQNEFNMQLQEYQINQQARQQQMNELWFVMDMMSFETPQQAQEREWNYWVMQQEYANWNINSKDKTTRHKAALKSVENLLAQYEWIPMERSAEQMADDILKAIDNWSTLGEELTKINKQIQQKPEYRQLYNQTYGTSQWFGEKVSIWWTDYVEYNWKLYTADDFNRQFWWWANYTVVSSDKLKTYSDGREWTYWSFMAKSKYNDGNYIWQCGKFVNDYLQEIWAGRLFWNETIDVREKWINSDEWKVGTVAVFDYNHYIDWKNYGHVGIVVSAPDKNGDFWVKDANFDKDWVIQTRKVNLKDVSLKWFIDPSLDQSWNRVSAGTSATLNTTNWGITSNWTTVGGLSKTYEPTRVWLYNKYLNEWTAPTDAKLKAIWGWDLDKWWQIFDAEVADYMAQTWAGSLDTQRKNELAKLRTQLHQEQTYKDYQSMKSYYDMIEIWAKDDSAAWDMSLIFAYMKMLDPGSTVREWEYATVENATNIPKKIWQKYNKAVNWEKLTEAQRKELLNVARKRMDSATKNYNQLLDDYAWYIQYWWDASLLGKKWAYITDEYSNRYWTTTNTSQEKNFYNTYVNTNRVGRIRPYVWGSADTITLSDGQSFER